MHDGRLATLEEVIDHYSAGGKMDHPNKSPILRPFRLTVAKSAIWSGFSSRSPTKSCFIIHG
jgi:hypothetical protein